MTLIDAVFTGWSLCGGEKKMQNSFESCFRLAVYLMFAMFLYWYSFHTQRIGFQVVLIILMEMKTYKQEMQAFYTCTHTPTQTNTGEKTFSHFISIREKSFGLCDKMQLNANEMAVSNGTK